MSFRLVPKSVTLNDLERRNGRYIALFHINGRRICDLMINTNLPAIVHRFQVMADYVNFSLPTGGRINLTPSLGAVPR